MNSLSRLRVSPTVATAIAPTEGKQKSEASYGNWDAFNAGKWSDKGTLSPRTDTVVRAAHIDAFTDDGRKFAAGLLQNMP